MFSRFRKLFSAETEAVAEVIAEVAEEQIICSICLDPVIGQRNCCMTECGHSFHTSCMLMTNGTCPNCRVELRRTQVEVASRIQPHVESADIERADISALYVIQRHFNIEETPDTIGTKEIILQFMDVYSIVLNAGPTENMQEKIQDLKRIASNYYKEEMVRLGRAMRERGEPGMVDIRQMFDIRMELYTSFMTCIYCLE
jgi:hypothetical protein